MQVTEVGLCRLILKVFDNAAKQSAAANGMKVSLETVLHLDTDVVCKRVR